MAILSTYSKTQDTSRSNYITNKEYMEGIKNNTAVVVPEDSRVPFTYQEWVQRNSGIIPGKETVQYNQYVKAWYNNTYTNTDTTNDLRSDYISLLKELKLYGNEEDKKWLEDIDFDDPLDIDDAIPLFVKKLREISIYFINKREAIKKAKLKYNMVGSENALRTLFYEYLLKAFTQRDYVLNVPEQSAYDTFPDLSAISTGFKIILEELYDDTNYYDKDPTVAVSSYYDLESATVSSYFDSLGFEISALNWLYGTGVNALDANNPLLWTINTVLKSHGVSDVSALPLSAYSEFNREVLNDYVRFDATKKYIGENQYILSGGYYVSDTRTVEHTLVSGNNWFYFPSGEYFREYEQDIVFDPIYLSATSLINDGAIAANNYKFADKIFIQNNNAISGSWLKYTSENILEDTMKATLFESRNTRFRFPYPGYGTSGDGLDWSGPLLENSYYIDTYDDSILNKYWKTVPVSAINPININDTKLIDIGAIPSQTHLSADKISVRTTTVSDGIHDFNPDTLYSGPFDRAWLYKMINTDIPISVGKTFINWPLHTYNPDNPDLPMNILSSQCIPITLSSISVETAIVGARSGYGLYDSDMIYKLNAPNGYPVECAWLSGLDLKTLAGSNSTLVYNATGKIQPSLTLKCKPGNYETFVWQDSSIFIDETSIVHYNHQVDCLYYINDHKSIHDTKNIGIVDLATNGIGDWNDCTCRAIKYSPLGHPGSNYSDYSYMTDIVFVDTQFPEHFDLDSWRGTDSLGYKSSKDFAFYQVSGNNPEPDVGWGAGQWKTGDGSRFRFETGVVYKYLRSNLLRNPGDLIVDFVPNLIIKHKHTNTTKAEWMKATLDTDGIWEKSTSASPMVLNAGDFIMYDHIDSNWYCLTSDDTRGSTVGTYLASSVSIEANPWYTSNHLTTGQYVDYVWPVGFYDDGPEHSAAELTAVVWNLIKPDSTNVETIKISPNNKFSYLIDQIGEYQVSGIGYGPFAPETFVVLPPVSGVNFDLTTELSGSLGITTRYNDRINAVINIPLSGWDYTSNVYNVTAVGGRPFWAVSYDNSSGQTKQKGTMTWGGGIRTPIDDYTFITQPDISRLSLVENIYVDYKNNGTGNIIWEEPIEFKINSESKRWCDLVINPLCTSPLSSYLDNINTEMVISATNNPSDIILSNESEMFVNYWANSAITWKQALVNSTNGIPPTGGLWVDYISGTLVDALVPYANILNRHFPTIATIPYIGDLYSREDVGGYFLPKLMGLTTYIGKGYTNTIYTDDLENTYNRELSAIFQNPALYTRDAGVSNKTQIKPISSTNIDSSWLKTGITLDSYSGTSDELPGYSEFIPYQTKYESTGFNYNGFKIQNDKYDPWSGALDNTWNDIQAFPENFRGEHNIDSWYGNIENQNKFVYQWKTDIFGNQYFLLKDRALETIYTKNNATGYMWTKNTDGNAVSASVSLSSIYNNFGLFTSAVSSDILNGQIRDFDIWFDTIMVYTTGHLLFEKIKYDYDTSRIYSIADDVHIIDLSSNNNGNYGGVWLFDEEKHVTICTVASSDYADNVIYPKLYNLDLESNILTTIFDGRNNVECNEISSVLLSSVEQPVFSYNNINNTYNISFVGYSTYYGDGMVLTTMNIRNTIDDTYTVDISAITPVQS